MASSSSGGNAGLAIAGLLIGAAAIGFVGYLIWSRQQQIQSGDGQGIDVNVDVPPIPQGAVDADVNIDLGDVGAALAQFLSRFGGSSTTAGGASPTALPSGNSGGSPFSFLIPSGWDQHKLDLTFGSV